MAYFGGKGGSGVYQTLINQVPPHDHYISPFGGMDAVLRHIRPASRCVVIDLDPEPLTWWARYRPDVEAYQCDGVAWLRHEFGLDRFRTSPHQTSTWPAGESTSPFLEASPDPATGDEATEACAACCSDLRSRDAGSRAKSSFVLVDPPYPQSVRTSDARYRAEALGHADHERILETVCELPSMVMVCCYPNDLYDHRLTGWRTVDYFATVRSGQRRRERLWMNYATPVELHDYRFVGSNKREREKIRRRSRNLAATLGRLSPHERGAVLESLAFDPELAKNGHNAKNDLNN